MDILPIIKGASEIAVSVGVGSIVGNAIKMTTDPNAGKLKKIAIGFGGFILSSMVSDMAGKYTTDRIDDVSQKLSNILKPKIEDDNGDVFVIEEVEVDDDGIKAVIKKKD